MVEVLRVGEGSVSLDPEQTLNKPHTNPDEQTLEKKKLSTPNTP